MTITGAETAGIVGFFTGVGLTVLLQRPQLCPRCHYQEWIEKARGGPLRHPDYAAPGFWKWFFRTATKWREKWRTTHKK